MIAGQSPLVDCDYGAISATPADVVLADGASCTLPLICWIRSIHERAPHLRIVVVDGIHDDDEVVSLIESGAGAYLSPSASASDLVAAVRGVRCGRTVISPRLIALVAARIREILRPTGENTAALDAALTLREQEVLVRIAAGDSNKEIASTLNIEVHTVKTHIHNVFEKLQAGSRRDAIRHALAMGLIHEPDAAPCRRCVTPRIGER
jgi:DNA-binding NarL/FixJ family response regulator